MSAGFGFSVGDFITGIQLVRDVITSLQASGGSSSEYQALAMELFSLERALLEVKALKSLDDQPEKLEALKCAASQCQHTIDRFMTKIQKFQSSLNSQGSGSRWRDGLRKIQWALCKKEDIATFKAEISGHAVAINLLVATAQFNATALISQRSEQFHRESHEGSTALATLTSWPIAAMNSLKDSIASCLRQGQELLATSKNIVQVLINLPTEPFSANTYGSQTNLQIFRAVLEIQKFMTTLPAQVLREQPVYFTDAYGLEVPFHLEFVYSSEILYDWLLRRFPKDKAKIEHGEFTLQDMKTKRRLSLKDQWPILFYPGMRVAMDIVYSLHLKYKAPQEKRPNCGLPSVSLDFKILHACPKCEPFCDFAPNMKRTPVFKEYSPIPWGKSIMPPSRFQRKRIRIPSPSTLPPPMLPIWLSRPLDSLRLRYPEDRFHVLMVVSIIGDSGQCTETEETDAPLPPGTNLKLVPRIACDDCEGKVTFPQRNIFDAERFAVHLRTPTHRQFVEARKVSRIHVGHSIIPDSSESKQTPNLQPSSESDGRSSPDGESVVPNKDPNSDLLPRSLSSPMPFQPPPDQPMGDYPPYRIYPEKLEAYLDGLARSSSNSDFDLCSILEDEGFEYVSLGREHLEGVKNDQKSVATTSTESAHSYGKGRHEKRRRERRRRLEEDTESGGEEEGGFEHVSLGREHLEGVKNDRKRVATTSTESAHSCGKGRHGKRRRGRRWLEKNDNRLKKW